MTDTESTDLQGLVRDRTLRIIQSGDLPDYIEREAYDALRVRVGDNPDESFLVTAPSQDATTKFALARAKVAALGAEGKAPTDKEIEVAEAAQRKAGVEYLTEGILEVGAGIKLRRGLAVPGKVIVERGQPAPVPFDLPSYEAREELLWRALPGHVVRKVQEAIGMLIALSDSEMLRGVESGNE